ncbi:terpene synthase [Nonomuraea sp. NN258]|uniref:terpene synthase family protein n=1 Tax=Nonomuraea antri TaxID=2730852 RepID=UPI00156A255D|nr:terpene synthase family protein [Nonomuraea antri]NRQ31772.1 terpene synthase [Nonomuraea antri]
MTGAAQEPAIGPVLGAASGLGRTAALGAASGLGRTAALAVACARDLTRHAAEHRDLFPERPFDPGFFHSLGLVSAFGSPGATVDGLRPVGRASLWVFAADLLIDHVAKTREEVTALVAECLAVAAGAEPATPVTRFLAGLRDHAAAGTGTLGADPRWRDQLARMLTAMAAEWDWRAGDVRIGLDDYLANAGSCGSSFVNLTHWLATGDDWTRAHLDEVRAAGDEAQRYLRLLNDLTTYDREARWGDANALTLGADRDEVTRRMAGHAGTAAELIGGLRGPSPATALYLERQLGFNTGFYGVSDYWGEL